MSEDPYRKLLSYVNKVATEKQKKIGGLNRADALTLAWRDAEVKTRKAYYDQKKIKRSKKSKKSESAKSLSEQSSRKKTAKTSKTTGIIKKSTKKKSGSPKITKKSKKAESKSEQNTRKKVTKKTDEKSKKSEKRK